jgi:hypothetical protein
MVGMYCHQVFVHYYIMTVQSGKGCNLFQGKAHPSFTNLSEKKRESKRQCQMMPEGSEHARMNTALFFLRGEQRDSGE